MDFDPILHKGYKKIQKLEPDLIKLQEALTWCDHFVIFYPNWWSTMPALLKGMLTACGCRVLHLIITKGRDGHFNFWKRRMYGKTARVFVLSATQPFFIWMLFGDYTNEIKRGILWLLALKQRYPPWSQRKSTRVVKKLLAPQSRQAWQHWPNN